MKLQKHRILCLVLALSLMSTAVLAQGSSPQDLSGTWSGSDRGDDMKAALTLLGREGGTLQLTMNGKTDTGKLTFDGQGLSFSVIFPKDNQIAVKSCSGTMIRTDDLLTLSLVMQFQDNSMAMPLVFLKRSGEAETPESKADMAGEFTVPQWQISLQVPPSMSESEMEEPPAGMIPFSFVKDTLPDDEVYTIAQWI